MLTIGSTSDTSVRAQFLSSTTGANTIQFGDGTGASAYSGYINYTHSDNALAFATGSAERMRIDSSGYIQMGAALSTHIGTSQLFVNRGVNAAAATSGTTQTGGALRLRGGDNAVLDMGMNSVNTWIQATDRANLALGYPLSLNPNGGNVGIGSASDGAILQLDKASSSYFDIQSDSTLRTRIYNDSSQTILETTTNNLIFKSASSEAMRINSAAQVLVGTQSKISADQGDGGLAVHGDTVASGSVMEVKNTGNPSSGRDLIRFYNTSNGEAGSIEHTGTSTVSYLTSSDYRLKENVVTLTGASERLKQIPVKRFNFIADGSDVSVDGFLAHEVQAVVPEAISGTKDAMKDEEYEVTAAVYEDVITPAVEAVDAVVDEDGVVITEAVEAVAETTESVLVTEAVMGSRSVPDYQGIDQAKLVPLLVAALQEAIARIEILEAGV